MFSGNISNSGAIKTVSAGGGIAVSSVVNAGGGTFAGTGQDPATPPQTGLYRFDGTRVQWIEENRLAPGHPYFPYLSRHRLPQFGTLTAADGAQLWWSLRTPPGFDPGRPASTPCRLALVASRFGSMARNDLVAKPDLPAAGSSPS